MNWKLILSNAALIGCAAIPAQAQIESKQATGFENDKESAGWVANGNATIDTTQFHSGQRSIKISRAKDTEAAQWVGPDFQVKAGETYRISGWMKSDNVFMPDPSFAPEAHVIFHNALFAGAGDVSFADYWKVPRDSGAVGLTNFSFPWKYFEKVIVAPVGAIGGKIRFSFSKTTGTAWLDDVRVTFEPGLSADGTTGASAAFLSAWPARAGEGGNTRGAGGGFFKPGEPLEWMLRTPDKIGDGPSVVKWRLTDALERQAGSGEVPITNTKAGSAVKVALPPMPQSQGRWIRCDWSWEQGDKVLAKRLTSFAILPTEGPAGPSVFGSYGNPGQYEFLKRLGANWVRSDIFWRDDNQPTPDVPIAWETGGDGGLLHNRLVQPKTFGFQNYAMFSWQAPKWAWLHQDGLHEGGIGYPAKPEARRKAAFDTVTKYKDSLKYWQLGNEVNLHEEQGRKEYLADFKAFSEGVKAADPEAKVILGSQNRSLDDLQLAINEGVLNYCDVIDWHYGDVTLLRGLREMLDKASPNRHIAIWQTEVGFFTQDLDDVYATDFIKIMATSAGEGVENIVWCYLGGVPSVSEREESSPDLTRGTYLTEMSEMPSQLFTNHVLLADFIQGAKPQQHFDWGTRGKGYLFRRGDQNSMVVWSEGIESLLGTIVIPGAKNVEIADWTARRQTLKTNGSLPVLLSKRPLLIRWTGPDVAQEVEWKEGSRIQITSKRARTLFKGTENVVTFALAAGASPVMVALDAGNGVTIAPAKIALKASESAQATVTIPTDFSASRLTLDATVTGENGTQSWMNPEFALRPALVASLEPRSRSNLAGSPNKAAWNVRLDNNGRKSATAQISLDSLVTKAARPEHFVRNVTVAPGQIQLVDFPVAIEPDFTQKYAASAKVKLQNETVNLDADAGFMGASFAAKPPKIDGDLSDWKRIIPANLNTHENYWRYHPESNKDWGGPADLSAKFYYSWDKSALYFAADVTDDKQVNDRDEGNIWASDSVELALQAAGTPQRSPITKVIVALAKGKPSVMISPEGNYTAPKPVELAAKRVGTHTIYEARIPWEVVYPLTSAAAGQRLRIAAMLNEDDGAGRVAYMNWFGLLTYPTKGETLFTDLQLLP